MPSLVCTCREHQGVQPNVILPASLQPLLDGQQALLRTVLLIHFFAIGPHLKWCLAAAPAALHGLDRTSWVLSTKGVFHSPNVFPCYDFNAVCGKAAPVFHVIVMKEHKLPLLALPCILAHEPRFVNR